MTKVRVFKLRGIWHWWCPCCVGGDFGKDVQALRAAAFRHANLCDGVNAWDCAA